MRVCKHILGSLFDLYMIWHQVDPQPFHTRAKSKLGFSTKGSQTNLRVGSLSTAISTLIWHMKLWENTVDVGVPGIPQGFPAFAGSTLSWDETRVRDERKDITITFLHVRMHILTLCKFSWTAAFRSSESSFFAARRRWPGARMARVMAK